MTTTSDLASQEGDGINAEKADVRVSAREILRPQIPARIVIRPTPSKGASLIKKSNQVPKYDKPAAGVREGL
jgi:hypothetical protein